MNEENFFLIVFLNISGVGEKNISDYNGKNCNQCIKFLENILLCIKTENITYW